MQREFEAAGKKSGSNVLCIFGSFRSLLTCDQKQKSWNSNEECFKCLKFSLSLYVDSVEHITGPWWSLDIQAGPTNPLATVELEGEGLPGPNGFLVRCGSSQYRMMQD